MSASPLQGDFSSRTFYGETIVLDGSEFRDCSFKDCQLTYSGGALPVLSGCGFERCRWAFGEEAGRTLSFLSALHAGGFSSMVEETLSAIRGGSLSTIEEAQQPDSRASSDAGTSRPNRIDLGFGVFPVPRIVKVEKPRS
ncbi:hypothetical protein HPQ64_00930 [Rhizobiales bacterium]|uniref:hypothetical protein n=1 Tax=Hongsoonwoonella zoysiae TaxID=2821844 RepID=UPI00155FD55F|nr:hypothetical protein [Hongsoonwoonella zoysiae]NRG16246.1 hypothetical protein [Hongsoonwoonella zoysiae]